MILVRRRRVDKRLYADVLDDLHAISFDASVC
jgi:hypothetical protein